MLFIRTHSIRCEFQHGDLGAPRNRRHHSSHPPCALTITAGRALSFRGQEKPPNLPDCRDPPSSILPLKSLRPGTRERGPCRALLCGRRRRISRRLFSARPWRIIIFRRLATNALGKPSCMLSSFSSDKQAARGGERGRYASGRRRWVREATATPGALAKAAGILTHAAQRNRDRPKGGGGVEVPAVALLVSLPDKPLKRQESRRLTQFSSYCSPVTP